jgi:protein-disulfide isomerase
MSMTPQPAPVPGAPDYSQPQAYGAGDASQGGSQGGYQGGYGYAPMPAPRSSVPLVIGLAVIGFVILIVASALVLLVAAPRNADQPGFGDGVPAIQTSGMDHVSSGGIVAPTGTTPATIPSSGRTLGNPNAPVTVDVYADYQCPPCQDFSETVMPQIINKYVVTGQVKIMSHDYLVIDLAKGGHESLDAANAALCAADQGKFWTFQDWLFANQGPEASGAFAVERLLQIGSRAGLAMNQFQPCVASGKHNAEVQAESSSAQTHLIGTPTVVVDGQTLPDFDYATVSAAIDQALGTSR